MLLKRLVKKLVSFQCRKFDPDAVQCSTFNPNAVQFSTFDPTQFNVVNLTPMQFNVVHLTPTQFNVLHLTPMQFNLVHFTPMQFNVVHLTPTQYNVVHLTPTQYNVVLYNTQVLPYSSNLLKSSCSVVSFESPKTLRVLFLGIFAFCEDEFIKLNRQISAVAVLFTVYL